MTGLPYRSYIQHRTGGIASPRPYDWTLVGAGVTAEQAHDKASEWIREANRLQSNPCMYWIYVTGPDNFENMECEGAN